jgi:hypothetical protein
LNTAIRTPTTVGLGSARLPSVAVSPVGPVLSVPVPPIVPPVNGTVAPPPPPPPSPEDNAGKA